MATRPGQQPKCGSVKFGDTWRVPFGLRGAGHVIDEDHTAIDRTIKESIKRIEKKLERSPVPKRQQRTSRPARLEEPCGLLNGPVQPALGPAESAFFVAITWLGVRGIKACEQCRTGDGKATGLEFARQGAAEPV